MFAADFDAGLFIGRFHPLLVHLPIGFLLLAIVFIWLQLRNATWNLDRITNLVLLLGAIAAIGSVIAGLLLAGGAGYSGETLDQHKWMGIWLAVLTSGFWVYRQFFHRKTTSLDGGIGVVLMVLLLVTGHLGGNLTHGSTYLTQYAPGFVQKLAGGSQTGVDSLLFDNQLPDCVVVYQDLIHPIFAANCLDCHNSEGKSGGLSMETYEALMEGGDTGPVIMAGDPQGSELMRRLALPIDHELFMPLNGKPLTYNRVRILEWWINQEAAEQARVPELEIDETVKKILEEEFHLNTSPVPYVERTTVKPLDSLVVNKLIEADFRVVQLASSNYLLDVQYMSDSITAQQLELLQEAASNITWLDLSGAGLTDDMLNSFANFEHLTRLRLQENRLTGRGLQHLVDLLHLESLNLYANPITDDALEHIENMKALKRIYIWQTAISPEALDVLQKSRPELVIESGIQLSYLSSQ